MSNVKPMPRLISNSADVELTPGSPKFGTVLDNAEMVANQEGFHAPRTGQRNVPYTSADPGQEVEGGYSK